MEILFVPPCCSPSFHIKATFENDDFERFWTFILGDLGVHPMSKSINMDKHALPPHFGKP